MDKKTIDRLLSGMKNGNNEDFASLYEETKRGLFAFLYSYYRNHHMTEDAVQDVFLKIKTNIHTYIPGTNGPAWMLKIAKNHALNDLKSKKNLVLPLDEHTISEAEDDGQESLAVTDFLKRTLDPVDFRIVTMHVVMEYKHREIGRILGMPTGTVTSRYKRALEKIRKEWKD